MATSVSSGVGGSLPSPRWFPVSERDRKCPGAEELLAAPGAGSGPTAQAVEVGGGHGGDHGVADLARSDAFAVAEDPPVLGVAGDGGGVGVGMQERLAQHRHGRRTNSAAIGGK